MTTPKRTKMTHESKCEHCGMNIAISNPSGFCNHVHYPESCDVCTKREQDRCEHKFSCIRCSKALSSPPVVEGKNEEIAKRIVSQFFYWYGNVECKPFSERLIKEALDQKDAEKSEIQERLDAFSQGYVNNCLIIPGQLDPSVPLFTIYKDGIVVRLDGYAIIKKEHYEALQSKLDEAVRALECISEDGFNKNSREGQIAIETLTKVKEGSK